jgi:ATPase family associated with various cellular activities (AAA)
MSDSEFVRWREQNRTFLSLAIDQLYLRMRLHAEESVGEELRAVDDENHALRETMTYPPALHRLAEAFELDAFEVDVVLLCTAFEVDPRFQVDGIAPTIGFVLGALPDAYWGALDLAAPLRQWGLVFADEDEPLVAAPLRAANDVIRYLLGFDPRVGYSDPFTLVAERLDPSPTLFATAQEIVRAVELATDVTQSAPAVELHGATEDQRLALAQVCAAELGAPLALAAAHDLPHPGPELDALVRRWNRCGALTGTSLLVTCAGYEDDPAVQHRVERLLERVVRPLFISVVRSTTVEPRRRIIRRITPDPTPAESVAVWTRSAEAALSRLKLRPTRSLTAEIDALATQFRLTASAIERICIEAEAAVAGDPPQTASGRAVPGAGRLAARLRDGCARFVRARLDPLAERVPLRDVVEVALPPQERAALEELEAQIRLSYTVNETWGLSRGQENGLTALFAGPTGTGKTQAALQLASRTGLDLYRINVASVLSKYIGETEQNLDRIFDAAQVGGTILLFDEADALFGKRSEVKDAHDRYANLGTAYLLQRIEHASTPTILTTNLKEGLDPAFTRRLHFVVDFAFPDEAGREQIWKGIFPPRTPRRGLEPSILAQLSVTGGTISAIARRGAFLAAADCGEVEMRHLRESALRELRTVGRQPAVEELEGW